MKITMKTGVKKVLIAVRDNLDYRGSNEAFGTAIKNGWIVWDYTPIPRNIMGGYILTDAGKSALEAVEARQRS